MTHEEFIIENEKFLYLIQNKIDTFMRTYGIRPNTLEISEDMYFKLKKFNWHFTSKYVARDASKGDTFLGLSVVVILDVNSIVRVGVMENINETILEK